MQGVDTDIPASQSCLGRTRRCGGFVSRQPTEMGDMVLIGDDGAAETLHRRTPTRTNDRGQRTTKRGITVKLRRFGSCSTSLRLGLWCRIRRVDTPPMYDGTKSCRTSEKVCPQKHPAYWLGRTCGPVRARARVWKPVRCFTMPSDARRPIPPASRHWHLTNLSSPAQPIRLTITISWHSRSASWPGWNASAEGLRTSPVISTTSLRSELSSAPRGVTSRSNNPGHIFGVTVALGPWISTLDELDGNDLKMIVRVNGAIWSEGLSATIMWSMPQLVAWASASEVGGSALEIGERLRRGDLVELKIAGVGTLRNRVGPHAGPGRFPSRRLLTVAETARYVERMVPSGSGSPSAPTTIHHIRCPRDHPRRIR